MERYDTFRDLFQTHLPSMKPPRLEDEPGVQWSDDMKDFIKET